MNLGPLQLLENVEWLENNDQKTLNFKRLKGWCTWLNKIDQRTSWIIQKNI